MAIDWQDIEQARETTMSDDILDRLGKKAPRSA